MSRILARNAYFPMHPNRHDWWYHSDIVTQLVAHTWRWRWWRLSPQTRHLYRATYPWHRQWLNICRKCGKIHYFFPIGLLKREGFAKWLVATTGRWWGNPRWCFSCCDFEELMSLRVEQSVTYDDVNTLRFRFLNAFVTDRQGSSIARWAREWLQNVQHDWDKLLHIEEQIDRIRDEISDLRRRQEEILQEMEQRIEGRAHRERDDPSRLPQDLQERWNEIAARLRRLEGGLEPGELQRLRQPLEDATSRLLPQLRERGVRFKVIEVEGVLGNITFMSAKSRSIRQ